MPSPDPPSRSRFSPASFFSMESMPEQGKRLAMGSRSRPINIRPRRKNEGTKAQQPVSSSSPHTWELLLSPPEIDGGSHGSFESDSTAIGPYSSLRSLSSDSVPSLTEDDDGSADSSSNSDGPASGARSKSMSASVGEDCRSRHPLMQQPSDEGPFILETPEDYESLANEADVPVNSKPSFRSNLTASLRAIRSAARSLSELGPPLRDDHLSRSLLSIEIPFSSEKRPVALQEPPSAAIRRYLNPIRLSPAELHFHTAADTVACKTAVQMQTYQPGARQSSNASSPPIFTTTGPKASGPSYSKDALDTEDALTSSLLPRQREPRENSDFLRVIVLEMNMRKGGKLNGTSPGRAKLWLPARQEAKPAPAGTSVDETDLKGEKQGYSRKVPRRWAGEMP